MDMKRLGSSDIEVSDLCLGTMTWGTQTSEAEGHRQMSAALDAGINFVDTAETYPVNPMSKEYAGDTEAIVGTWFAANGRRSDVVLATKISGAGNKAVRDGAPITAENIPLAVEGSLKRMQTDYIDLYQLHWPNRGSYMFRQNWHYDPSKQDREATRQHMHDVLGALRDEVTAGRIRTIGLSNESAWGTAEWLRIAREMDAPEVVSIQNEYSLLCRLYDTDLAELSVNENVGLLAFSPLAAGYLTGKYRDGAVPEGSRKSINGTMGGRATPRVQEAADAYVAIAEAHGIDPTQMALAWCQTRPFMGSVIFGATTFEQLEVILAGKDLKLSDQVMKEISETHRRHPMPY